MSAPLIKKILDSIKNINTRVKNLENHVELFNGCAQAGDTITLNDSFKKYRFLHVITGTTTKDFGGALVGSTVNSNEEIHCMKTWVNDVLSMQVHSVFLNVNDYTHLTVTNAAYKQIATNGVTVSSNVNGCYVKKIYGCY